MKATAAGNNCCLAEVVEEVVEDAGADAGAGDEISKKNHKRFSKI